MKKAFVAVAALAFALGAFADTVPVYNWFSANPAGTLTGCSWNTAPETEGGKWIIDTDETDSILTPTATVAIDKTTRVVANIAFEAAYPTNKLPTVSAETQTGLVLGFDGTTTNFYGLVSGGWKKLTGGVPADLDTEVAVTIAVNYGVDPVTVSFMVGDTLLTNGDTTSFARYGYSATSATGVSAVAFSGTGKLGVVDANTDAKYVVDNTGYIDFDAAVAAAGNNAITLYANAAYTFDGSKTLAINANGYTFTPTYPSGAFSRSRTASGVTTYICRTAPTFAGGAGTQASPYQISNADDLYEFAYWVSQDMTFASTNFQQTADIDVTGTAWEPVKSFSGIYDGGNKQITFTLKGEKYTGFFKVVNNATIKNLVLNTTVDYSGTTNVGGGILAGVATGTCRFENVTAEGSFTASHNVCGLVCYDGGSQAANLTFVACTNNATLRSVYSKAGGILCYASAAGSTVRFENCCNTASITLPGGDAVEGCKIGGICAANWANATYTFVDCVNSGTLTGTQNICKNSPNWSVEVGGIMGQCTEGSASFTRCVNTGAISGTSGAGANGSVSADAEIGGVGGIVGKLSVATTFTDCSSAGTVTSTVKENATRCFDGSFVGYAGSSVTASGVNTSTLAKKPLGSGSCVALSFATLASDVYTFCGAPTAAGTYYVMLNNASAISFGAAVGDVLTLTSVNSAAYTGTVSTEVAQAKVTSATVAPTTTYTIAWDTVTVTIADAANGKVTDVAAGTSGQKPVKGEGSTYTAVKGDTLTVTYTANENYVFSGKTTTTTVDLVAAAGASATPPTFVEGKATYASELYDTVQNAVTAAAGQTAAEINVVKGADETVEVPADTAVFVTTASGVTLTGSIDATASNASVKLRTGSYDFGACDYSAFCDKGYWPTAGAGTAFTVAVGEPEIAATETMPAQNLPAGFFEGAQLNDGTPVTTATQKTQYLEEVPTGSANNLPRWANEALGITPSQQVPVVAPETGDATIDLGLAAGAVPVASSGLTVSYLVGDSKEPVEEVTFTLDDTKDMTGVTTVQVCLADANGKSSVVKTIGFGVMQKKGQKAFDMVPVSWTSVDGTPITVANLVKTANLTAGDLMHVYEAAAGAYATWELTSSKTWERVEARKARSLNSVSLKSAEPITDPAAYVLAKGQAVWLDRQRDDVPIYTYGGASAETGSIDLAAGMTLVANPKTEAVAITTLVTGAANGDQIIINDQTYTYNGSAWTKVVTTTTTQKVRGVDRTVTKTQTVVLTDAETLPAGQGFWYSATGSGAKVNW